MSFTLSFFILSLSIYIYIYEMNRSANFIYIDWQAYRQTNGEADWLGDRGREINGDRQVLSDRGEQRALSNVGQLILVKQC